MDEYQPLHRLTQEERHQELLGWFVAETTRQRANRLRMAKCEAYYDLYQYEPNKLEEIKDRGQTPVVFDRIASQVDYLIGTERRSRVEHSVTPRNSVEPEALKAAETKGKLLRYIEDVDNALFWRSRGFTIAAKAGLSWMEIIPDIDNSGGSKVTERALSWREIVHDTYCGSMDPQLMRYIFRVKVVDLDIALALFPNKRDMLMSCVQTADDLDAMRAFVGSPGSPIDLEAIWGATPAMAENLDHGLPLAGTFNSRKRVLLIEAHVMTPHKVVRSGFGLGDAVKMVPHITIMTERGILDEYTSPYKHGRYQFVPFWQYIEEGTGLPYSMVRRLIDKQDGLNQTLTRAHFEITTNQIVTETSAIDDTVMTIEEIREEVDDPNGAVVLANGGLDKFQVRKGHEQARAHMEMAQMYIQTIDEASSISREVRGADSSTISGKARQIKQEQGAQASAEIFDNALFSRKLIGEIKLSLMEQWLVAPMTFLTKGEQGKNELIALNQPREDGTYENDIAEHAAMFVIDQTPWNQSAMSAQFEKIMALLGDLAPFAPQVVIALLDLVFESADIPNKRTALERIRAVTGQPGPDQQKTPEQQAQEQRASQLADAEFQAKLASIQAEIRKAEGTADKLDAEAIGRLVSMLNDAVNAAQTLQANPAAAPIADEILKTVGFKDRAEALSQPAGALQ